MKINLRGVKYLSKVSIIISIYNVEKFLHKCINSVINQIYKNLEIILVDDGSTDKSSEICDYFQSIDNRIIVIHKKNGGLSSARNAGLKIASGEFVYFVDGDDYIDRNLISTIIPYFNLNNDICVFGFKKVDESNDLIQSVVFPKMRIFLHNEQELLKFIIEFVLKYHHGWEAWDRIYKMDIINKYNLNFYDNKEIFAEDLYFYICYIMHCKSIQIIDKCLYNYLLRDGSIMSQSKQINKIKEFCNLSENIYAYIKNETNLEYVIDNYSLIHFRILKNEIIRSLSYKMNAVSVRRELIQSSFCIEQYKKILSSNKMLEYIKRTFGMEDINFIKFFITGNFNSLRIKNKLLYMNIDKKISRVVQHIYCHLPYLTIKKHIYLIGYENFGNLGDHQIRLSEIEFIKKIYPNTSIITIPVSKYYEYKKWLKRKIGKKDLILLNGGGNLGDYYPMAENVRRDVISEWKDNKIVIFPQTIFFSKTEDGYKSRKGTTNIYNTHKNLTLSLRENVSYIDAKKDFKCNLILCPDIVLFSRYKKRRQLENKILLCLRNDVEQKLSLDDLIIINNLANKYYNNSVYYDDLQYFYSMSDNESIANLNSFFEMLSTFDLVITDRLHGMIFCAISGIKCIVLGNYNHKIKGVYQWITDLEYIKYIDKIELLEKTLIDIKSAKINIELLDNLSFDPLEVSLKEKL